MYLKHYKNAVKVSLEGRSKYVSLLEFSDFLVYLEHVESFFDVTFDLTNGRLDDLRSSFNCAKRRSYESTQYLKDLQGLPVCGIRFGFPFD